MTLLDEGSGMKRDSEVLLMRRERAKGRTQEQAAARAGMSVRTLRRYERRGRLPSQFQQPRMLDVNQNCLHIASLVNGTRQEGVASRKSTPWTQLK
jgi:hypothetical protein